MKIKSSVACIKQRSQAYNYLWPKIKLMNSEFLVKVVNVTDDKCYVFEADIATPLSLSVHPVDIYIKY